MPGQQQYLERLKLMRQTLSNELMDIINEYGPKLFDDFDKACGFPVVLGPCLTINLESNCIPFLKRSHVEWRTGAEAKAEWGYSGRRPRESPFTSHGAYS